LRWRLAESRGQFRTASGRGFGKRSPLGKCPRRGGGGQGVSALVTNERNGALIAAVHVQGGEELMLISDQGTLVRTRVDEVSLSGRNTQGVTLIKLASDEVLVGLERVQEPSGGDDEDLPEGEEAAESLGESAESESEPAAEAEGNEE
ncbi:DNA gyrase C-terminal beta-propeller domain-containing protein, partial [Pseudomonas aeruginosa]